MSLSKKQFIGQILIDQFNNISVRTDTVIYEDEKEISRTFFRESFNPGNDVSSAPEKVQLIAGVIWTQSVIDDYQQMILSQLSPEVTPVP